ncbi:MAG: hypothetical protein JRM86_02750 [Nitrososphaerota archaeon]|nr:hypothetical protein [Nitrososphaerota archaeon]
MRSTSGAAGKGPSALIFVAILVAASALSFSVAMSPFIIVSHDPSALRLTASLNSTSIQRNGTLGVTVSEASSLRVPVELPLARDWAVQNLTAGVCPDPAAYPFGVAVFQGVYGRGNASSAVALPLIPPGGSYMCGLAGRGDSARFPPLAEVTLTDSFSGYFTSGYTELPGGGASPGVFHAFSPGRYTLVAGDEWGHLVFLYFQVGQVAASLKEIVLCTLVCGYPLPNLSGTVSFQAPSPLHSLEVSINGTSQGTVTYHDPAMASVDLETQYDSGPPAPPVVAHDRYVLSFVLVFDDGSTVTLTKALVGG